MCPASAPRWAATAPGECCSWYVALGAVDLRGCVPPVCGVNSNTLLAWACGWPQMETDAERIGQVGGRVVVILRVCCSC